MGKVRYVRSIDKPPENGILYSAGFYNSSIYDGEITTKSAEGFKSVELAELAKEIWDEKGFSGNPASPAAFFREMYWRLKNRNEIETRMSASINHSLYPGFYGGWIENVTRGVAHGPIYHYDLNSAYLWAGLQSLPVRFRCYEPGDEKFIVLARVKDSRLPLPVMIAERDPVLLTHEDIDYYGIDAEIIQGASWTKEANIVDEVLFHLADLPYELFKPITQSYWGVWAARGAIRANQYKSGELVKTWKIRNRTQNIAYAQIIISRVTRRVHAEALKGFHLVYVDSVLADHRVPTGENIGDWKFVEEFPNGVYIQAPGVWARMPDEAKRRVNYWHKHAGYADLY